MAEHLIGIEVVAGKHHHFAWHYDRSSGHLWQESFYLAGDDRMDSVGRCTVGDELEHVLVNGTLVDELLQPVRRYRSGAVGVLQ